MGICGNGGTPSQTDKISKKNENENAYIVHLINSSNIPTKGVDILDGIQAFCKIQVKTPDGISKYNEHKTTIRHSSDEPAWNCYRKIIASKHDKIHIHLYDEDWFVDDFLGEATLEITSDIKFNEMIELQFKMIDQFRDIPAPNIRLKIYHECDYNISSKRIYFIRHGTSEFNEALEKSDLIGMWSKTDHPLSEKGIVECEIFNDKIKNKKDCDVDDFLSVDGIWTSPLCRAVQTTFIGLHCHPYLIKSGMLLLSNCREFKSIGGRDSTGNGLGTNIRDRCFEKLKKYRNNDEYIDKYKQIAFDFNDTLSKWWSGINDTNNKEIDERFDDFVNFVRYRPERNIIIVTHSVFIRYFFKRYLPKKDDTHFDALFNDKYENNYFYDDINDENIVKNESDDDNISYYEKLSTYKLSNGGCIRVDIECNDKFRDGIIVKDTKLMFESKLQKRGKKKEKSN